MKALASINLAGCLLVVVLCMAGCGSSTSDKTVASNSPSSTAPTTPNSATTGPAAPSDSTESGGLSITQAAMTGDPESKKEQDTFTPDTPKIYVEAELADTKDGDTVKGVFICDSSKISPPNYKIDELTQHLKAGMREAQFSCTKPTTKEGWPEGSYHVDLYVNDKLVKTLKYTVAAGG